MSRAHAALAVVIAGVFAVWAARERSSDDGVPPVERDPPAIGSAAPTVGSPDPVLFLPGCFGPDGQPLGPEYPAELVSSTFRALAVGDESTLASIYGGTDWNLEMHPGIQAAVADFEAGLEALPAIYAASERGANAVSNGEVGFGAVIAEVDGAMLTLLGHQGS